MDVQRTLPTPYQPPPRLTRVMGIALVGSLLFHIVALFGVPQLDFTWLRTSEPQSKPPIQARIAAPIPTAAVPPPPTLTPKRAKAPAKPRPKPAPPVPSTMALDAADPPPAVNEQLRDRNATPEPDVVPPVEMADATPPDARPFAEPATTPPPAETLSETKPETEPTAAAEPTPAPAKAEPPDAGPPAKYPLRSARLVYDLSYGFGGSIVGSVTHTLAIDGATYKVETIVAPTGLAAVFYGGHYVQRSSGRIGPAGFIPDEYFVMRGQETRSERASFDWNDKKIAFSWPVKDTKVANGWRAETRTGELAAGIQDPVSMLHQLYFMQPLASSAKLSIASSRKVSQHAYEVVGEEMLTTPLGDVTTIKVRRRDEDSDQLDLWLDPSRNMLPLKIYYEDRRRTVLEQNIREYSAEAAP
ncbi:MAG: DUF3108 domain-containing protein [Burkholderiales bacterium]